MPVAPIQCMMVNHSNCHFTLENEIRDRQMPKHRYGLGLHLDLLLSCNLLDNYVDFNLD